MELSDEEYNEQQEAYEQQEEDRFNDEVFRVAENMQKYGGGFIRKLGMALGHANRFNAQKIKQAFPEHWEKYKKM